MKKFFSATMLAISLLLTHASIGQIYISIEGIDGESQLRDFPNSTQIESVSFGGENKATIGTAGSGISVGKVSFSDISIMKLRGAASGPIQMAVYAGKRITKAEIRFYNPAQTTAYLTIILEDVVITEWKISGTGSERATETVSFVALRVKTEEIIRNPNGTTKRVATGWDIARNTAIAW